MPSHLTGMAWDARLGQIAVSAPDWLGLWQVEGNDFQSLMLNVDSLRSPVAGAVAWSPDGTFLAVRGMGIQVLTTDTWRVAHKVGFNDDYYMNAYRGLQSLAG
jgi:hypothetical protein